MVYGGHMDVQGAYRCMGAYKHMGTYKHTGAYRCIGVYGCMGACSHMGDIQMPPNQTDIPICFTTPYVPSN